MNLEQEKELVERAKNDTEAFGELYDQYYSQIFGYVLRRTASIGIALLVWHFIRRTNYLHRQLGDLYRNSETD